MSLYDEPDEYERELRLLLAELWDIFPFEVSRRSVLPSESCTGAVAPTDPFHAGRWGN